MLSCTDNIEKFDTHVHSSATQEINLGSSCIEEMGVKSIFPELGKYFDSRVQVNLANSVLSESPKFISLRHPTMETADVRNIDFTTFSVYDGDRKSVIDTNPFSVYDGDRKSVIDTN